MGASWDLTKEGQTPHNYFNKIQRHLGSFISSIENWRDSFFAPNFVSCSFRIDKEMGIALFKVPINSYLAFFQ
jgi:hypothetical protein